MKTRLIALATWLWLAPVLLGQALPDNLVAEGIPPHPEALVNATSRYLEFRTAGFLGWHPVRREMLITTRFADTLQLHVVDQPLGMRRQLTFGAEPASSGSFQPRLGRYVVFSQDTGGGEFYQLYRYDLADGRVTRLTDGKSRNTSVCWAKFGSRLVWSSTRRNGRDTDLWVMDPENPATARVLLERQGGGWAASDWSRDGRRLLIGNYVSINDSAFYIYDVATRQLEPVLPPPKEKTAYSDGRFSPDGRAVYCTTDQDSEFHRLVRIELATRRVTVLTAEIPWDVETFEVSPDGRTIAFVTNEDGASVLRLLDTRTGKIRKKSTPKLPPGVINNLEWHENGKEIGFSLAHARSPSDCYSLEVSSGTVTRWTASETGGLDVSRFAMPEPVRLRAGDGVPVTGMLYRPDPKKFQGKRPVMVVIHGGPEGQSRPIFQARNNYYLEELGIALLYPNVRGSAGYGKRFLTLDNGVHREDSVNDIGVFLNWIESDLRLDADRIGVTGGSYGGFMTLASMARYHDRLRCAIDIVGISNFVTFLENTQEYRRDLRRVEYGDERDPQMREFLTRISPTTNVGAIDKPMFIVQGKNDPRVPVTEAEQMVKALRDKGGTCWYLLAKDEGHGFAKKKNIDYQFLSSILFWNEFLLK